jgi:hypothetical protein
MLHLHTWQLIYPTTDAPPPPPIRASRVRQGVGVGGGAAVRLRWRRLLAVRPRQRRWPEPRGEVEELRGGLFGHALLLLPPRRSATRAYTRVSWMGWSHLGVGGVLYKLLRVTDAGLDPMRMLPPHTFLRRAFPPRAFPCGPGCRPSRGVRRSSCAVANCLLRLAACRATCASRTA